MNHQKEEIKNTEREYEEFKKSLNIEQFKFFIKYREKILLTTQDMLFQELIHKKKYTPLERYNIISNAVTNKNETIV